MIWRIKSGMGPIPRKMLDVRFSYDDQIPFTGGKQTKGPDKLTFYYRNPWKIRSLFLVCACTYLADSKGNRKGQPYEEWNHKAVDLLLICSFLRHALPFKDLSTVCGGFSWQLNFFYRMSRWTTTPEMNSITWGFLFNEVYFLKRASAFLCSSFPGIRNPLSLKLHLLL